MKISLLASKKFRAISLLIMLTMSVSCRPAVAGHWEITLSGGTITPDRGTGTYTFTNSQVTGPPPFPSSFFGPDYHPQLDLGHDYCSLLWLSSGTISMVVAATLTWTPDAPGDTSQPPSKVSVLETGDAGSGVGINQPTSVDTTANDGLGDVMTFPAPAYYGAQCHGSHLLSKDVAPGQTKVTLPPRFLGSSLSWLPVNANTGGPGMSNYYGVKIFSGTLLGYSTACAPALCGPNPQPANWDATKPRYFSGTGCEAVATVVPLSGYITHAQLCIVDNGGDTVVKEYWDTGASSCPNPVPTDGSVMTGTNNTSGASLKALFDSTHFANSSIIVIKLRVWDSNGGYYDGAIQGPAKNRIYAW